MPPELVRVDDEIVTVRLGGKEFSYEPETGESTIPKNVLHGFPLSEIPEELIIKPVESIAGGHIEINNDIGLSPFIEGSASAFVELMLRRKSWDGEVGLSPYVEAYRQAIREREEAQESDYQDDGDYVFLDYEIELYEDLQIEDAVRQVEEIKELVAIVTATDGPKATDFAESVRQGVEGLSFANAAPAKVTVSLGVALAPGDGNTAEELLKKADAALYRAKNEGRNRVKSAS